MAQCYYRAITFKIPESMMSYKELTKFVKESFAGDNHIYYKESDEYFTRIICADDFEDALKKKKMEFYVGKATIQEAVSKRPKPVVKKVESILKPKMMCSICNKIIVSGNTVALKCGHNAHDKCGGECSICKKQVPVPVVKPKPLPEFTICNKCHTKIKTDAYDFHLKQCFICAICLEQTSEQTRYFLECGNFFHRDCWDKWHKSVGFNKKCPVCGFKVNEYT